MELNPVLKVGDKISVIHMDGESIFPGTKGIVLAIYDDPWGKENKDKIYSLKLEDGRKLGLVSVSDFWAYEKDYANKLNEDTYDDSKWYMDNQHIFNNFDVHFLMNFLLKLKASSIVNMYQAAPYLYMGREKIAHEFYYNPPANEDEFEEMLDMADETQSIMINGSISLLDEIGDDYDDAAINRLMKLIASKIIFIYTLLHK